MVTSGFSSWASNEERVSISCTHHEHSQYFLHYRPQRPLFPMRHVVVYFYSTKGVINTRTPNIFPRVSAGHLTEIFFKQYSSCALFISCLNSLISEKCGSNFEVIIYKLIVQNSSLGTHCEIALRWMSHNLIGKKLALVQVMGWCRQATGHYLSQCWPSFMGHMASICHNQLIFNWVSVEQTH